MRFEPAKMLLNEQQISDAIAHKVREQGYEVGRITLTCSPHQFNGPDTFSAVVEVDLPGGQFSAKRGGDK
jgi:hypothetical protein